MLQLPLLLKVVDDATVTVDAASASLCSSCRAKNFAISEHLRRVLARGFLLSSRSTNSVRPKALASQEKIF